MPNHESFTATLVRYIYCIAIILLAPLYFVLLTVKAKRTSQQPVSQQWQRLGAVSSALNDVKPGGIWFHCASVGEVVTATPLIKRLLKSRPDLSITITTMTTTGSERVKSEFAEQVAHCYLPFDLPWLLKPLFNRIKPQKLVITEVELWPNVLNGCARRGIPVDLINARMTERSATRYTKLSLLFKPMLNALHHVYAQGKRDADSYLKLGLAKEKLTLSNNMKFDRAADSASVQTTWSGWPSTSNKHVLIAGSTHAPEEQLLLQAAESTAELLLVLVPRYPERFDEVAALCQHSGLSWQRLSETNQINAETRILLVDKMGMLNECFQHGHMAFVGGSIAPRGGHNALEPAAQGLPIMMGPSRFNNPYICQTLADAGALYHVDSAQSIQTLLQQWIEQPYMRNAAGEAGEKVIKDNRGAVQLTFNAIASDLH